LLKSKIHNTPSRLFIAKSKILIQHCVVCLLILAFCLLYLPCAAFEGTETIVVGWNPSPFPAAGYEFCYGTSSGNYDNVVDVGNHTSCSISGLEKGTTYYFSVKAYSASGLKSDYSPELPYTIPAAATSSYINGSSSSNRVADGLQALYTFDEGSGIKVHDTSGVGEPLDLAIDSGAVEWVPSGLAIRSPALIKSSSLPTKIIEACQATNEISIEAWVKPANTTLGGPGRIVTMSKNWYYRNFTLGQAGDTFNQRLRTTATDANGIAPLVTPNGYLTSKLTHVLYIFDDTATARIYVNGAEASSSKIGGDLSNWYGAYYFGLGNEMTLDRPWLGELYMVAIYNRALNADEIDQNFRAGLDNGDDLGEPDDPTEPDVPSEPDEADDPDAPSGHNVKVWIEAEDGILDYPMEVATDSSASSGGFIWVQDGWGNLWNPNVERCYAEYSFEVPADGEYIIWGRIKGTKAGDDSFYVSVDNGDWAVWDTSFSKSWVWDKVSNRKVADPVIYYLKAGEHILIIKEREDGTKIDQIVITNDMEYVPD
jgi:hypothetical protein